jgi:hypothetical protein
VPDTSVGNIAIGFTAATGGFTGGADAIIKKLGQIKIAGDLVGKAWSMMSDTFARMDDLVDTADIIGINTDALIGLRFAADQAGSSAEGMDAALQTMMKNIGLAGMGQGRAGKALKELNLEVAALSNLSPDQMFRTIAQAIGQLSDESQQSAIASRIFGDEGQKLLNLFRSGGLEDAITQAGQLGLTMGEGARQAAEAHDAMRRVSGAVQALSDKIIIALAPSILRLVDLFTKNESKLVRLAQVLGEIAEDAAEGVFALAETLGLLIDPLQNAPVPLNNTAKGIREVGDAAAKAGQQIVELGEDFEPVEHIEKILTDLNSKLVDLKMAGENKDLEMLKALGATPEQLEEAESLQRQITEQKALADLEDQRLETLREWGREAQRVFESTRTPLEKLESEMGNLQLLLEQGMIDFATFSRAAANLQEDFNRSLPRGERSRSPELAAAGSAAAFSIINNANKADTLEDIARKQLQKQAEEIIAAHGIEKAVNEGFDKLLLFEL